MEMVDLGMADKVIAGREFTLNEYIDNTMNSENDIEIQVDHLEIEIKNYKVSKIIFKILGLLLVVCLVTSIAFFRVPLTLLLFNVVCIMLCAIIVNQNSIILKKLYLIEMTNQIINSYYKKLEDDETPNIRKILANW